LSLDSRIVAFRCYQSIFGKSVGVYQFPSGLGRVIAELVRDLGGTVDCDPWAGFGAVISTVRESIGKWERHKGGTGQIVGKRAKGEGNGKESNWGRVKDSPEKRGI